MGQFRSIKVLRFHEACDRSKVHSPYPTIRLTYHTSVLYLKYNDSGYHNYYYYYYYCCFCCSSCIFCLLSEPLLLLLYSSIIISFGEQFKNCTMDASQIHKCAIFATNDATKWGKTGNEKCVFRVISLVSDIIVCFKLQTLVPITPLKKENTYQPWWENISASKNCRTTEEMYRQLPGSHQTKKKKSFFKKKITIKNYNLTELSNQ